MCPNQQTAREVAYLLKKAYPLLTHCPLFQSHGRPWSSNPRPYLDILSLTLLCHWRCILLELTSNELCGSSSSKCAKKTTLWKVGDALFFPLPWNEDNLLLTLVWALTCVVVAVERAMPNCCGEGIRASLQRPGTLELSHNLECKLVLPECSVKCSCDVTRESSNSGEVILKVQSFKNDLKIMVK